MSAAFNPNNITCPNGYGPDLLFRFQLEPLFTTPYGYDCYFSYLGYDILGGITVTINLICILAHLLTLFQGNKKLLSAVRISNIILLLTILAMDVSVWITPSAFHIYQLISITTQGIVTGVWAYFGYQSLLMTIIKTGAQKTVSVVSLSIAEQDSNFWF
jgi:hypothetical protein